jgi:hypothetical protein
MAEQLICPNCKFTFTLPVKALGGRVPCPMCKTPIPTGSPAGGPPTGRQGPHGFDRPGAFARPESPTAHGTHGTHGAAGSRGAPGDHGSPHGPPAPAPLPSDPTWEAPRWDDAPGGSGNAGSGSGAVAGGALADPGPLLAKSWEIFKLRYPALLALYGLAALMALLPLALGAGFGAIVSAAAPGGILVGVAAGAVGSLWAGSWGLAALYLAVADDALSVGAALAAARPRAWSFAWIMVLVGFVVTGGTLLLLVPGILFALWFSLAPFAFIEGAEGMSALLRCRALVAGHALPVLGRLAVVALLGAVVGSVPVLGPLLAIAFFPYQAIYTRLLFDDLRARRPGARLAAPGVETLRILGVAVAGYGVATAAVLTLVLSTGPGPAAILRTGFAVLRGDPEAAVALGALAGKGGAAGGPPQDFRRGLGAWRGTEPDSGKEWIVTVTPPDRVDVRASGEEFYTGRARAMSKLGVEEDGAPVLPGGGLFDLVVEESSDPEAAGKIMLGSWKFDGPDALQLCLGRPGGFQRTDEFPAGGEFLCAELAREGR